MLNSNESIDDFDFTDSIITNISWADNLLDLIITVDYYWDVQSGCSDTRLLNINFKNCINANFMFRKQLPLNSDEVNTVSCFTIVLFRLREDVIDRPVGYKSCEIFTTDYEKPWLTVICEDVSIVETQT